MRFSPIKAIRSNVILSLTLTVAAITIALALFAQLYVNVQYQEGLQRRILDAETVSLELSGRNVYTQLKPYMNQLYNLAIDAELYRYAKARVGQEDLPGAAMSLIRARFKNSLLYTKEILSVLLIYEDGKQVRYAKADEPYRTYLRLSGNTDYRREVYRETKAAKTPVVFFETGGRVDNHEVYIALPLIGAYGNKEDMFAALYAAVDMTFLSSTFREIDADYVQNFLIDAQRRVIMCADTSLIGQVIDADRKDDEILYMETKVNEIGWKLLKRIDRVSMRSDMTDMAMQINILYLALFIVLTAVVLLTAYRLLRPLRVLTSAMHDAGEGNLMVRLNVEGDNEIWRVIAHFNRMMDKLHDLYESNKRYFQQALAAEKRHQQAEMAVLESHINAHFLFNALNAINFQALECGNRQVSMSIKRLANIMRYAFDKENKDVMLCQETAWVEQYLYMQKERVGDGLDYNVEIDEEAANWPMRKMMLQPFVENAIQHGLEGCENGVILLKAFCADAAHVVITISDNGCGMSEETLKRVARTLRTPRIDSDGGIGISNVAERIYAFFGPEAELRVASTLGTGTVFTLILPVPRED